MRKKKKYSSEQKIIILRELLENDISVSQLSEKYSVNPVDIYNCPIGIPSEEKETI
jgi:transposase-like protein